jgi:two-component system response regulator BasR
MANTVVRTERETLVMGLASRLLMTTWSLAAACAHSREVIMKITYSLHTKACTLAHSRHAQPAKCAPMTVLVVEDEVRLAASLVKGLTEEGFAAVSAGTAGAALARAAAGGLRAIVLDLGLPDRDGQQLIQLLRRDLQVPILVLTARDTVEERVRALDNGADDYLVKPFAFAELIARLRATLRRAEPPPAQRLCAGDVELESGEPLVRVGRQKVLFSPRERALLELLVLRLGQVVPRREILREAFGYDFDPGTNVVEVHISHVRRKLSESQLSIETVRNFGYRARVI